jgi:hypothetical protein
VPSFETIKEFAQCWSDARLRERAKLWPNPLTWTWFLGDRCAQYSRKEIGEILSIAVAYLQRTGAKLPHTASNIWRARESAEKPTLLAAMAELGQFFDAWEQGIRDVPPELEAALGELCGFEAVNTGGIREALPPTESANTSAASTLVAIAALGISLPPEDTGVFESNTPLELERDENTEK